MKSVLVLSVLVVLTHGRPEPPSGYNYPSPPSTRYGAPSGGQDQGRSGSSGGQLASGGSGFGGGFGSGSAGSFAGAFGNGGGFGGSFSSGQSSSSSESSQSGQASSSARSSASADSIIINKHVYVHIAPPELEDEQQQKPQVRAPPPQKNYKIIFIKAPTSATANVPQIPPAPQNEEKTLVYVLVKKPEDQSEIEIPTPAPTEPSRPEVYFIKYKSKKESGEQQQEGIADAGNDDTVEVGARGGASGAGPTGGQSGGYSYSSSGAAASNGVSRQYGAPNSSRPY